MAFLVEGSEGEGASAPAVPIQCLTTEEAVRRWSSSPGLMGFTGWLRRRCEKIRGREIMDDGWGGSSIGIQQLMRMLSDMMDWVKEVPALPASNQRFGNLAFRSYIKLVEDRLPPLLASFDLPPVLLSQMLPLLLNSYAFGHPTRMDYGTGHELAFVLGLWCCIVSGWIGGENKEDEEDELILRVFTKYTDLTTLLQSTYRLEPAGSHGVWGLDDYCFLPYLFGAAQLLDTGVTPSSITKAALNSSPDARPKDLYSLSLTRIKLFKHGAPFSEHSPMLNTLSHMPSFVKPFSGLMKMFHGEVLGKRVVVQGLWVGGWCWGNDLPDVDRSDRRVQVGRDEAIGIKAPWAVDGRQQALRMSTENWP